MRLKAILVCEDVRFEVGGTLTLVGIFNERLIAPAGDGPIQVPRLACLAVIGGLRGVEQIAFRQWIRIADEDGELPEMTLEPHEADQDEHNFVFAQSPMVFPGEGTYEVGIDLEAGTRRATYRYPFTIVRR